MKALTAMKLVKEDGMPGAVFPDLFIGSVGAAYNKDNLQKIGITHILTCAANIKPRFPEVSERYFQRSPSHQIPYLSFFFITGFQVRGS